MALQVRSRPTLRDKKGHHALTSLRQLGSITGHSQRNMGLDLTNDKDGLIYFVDGDNVVHPNFWALVWRVD